MAVPEESTDLLRANGPVSWMAENRVAANLLMFVLIVAGLMISRTIKQEVFPEFDLDTVRIAVPYRGASPAEVEQGILLALEEEVRGLDGVKKVSSVAYEGAGTVSVELLDGVDENKALQDVKNAIDRIQSLPEEAERPVVSLPVNRNNVVSVILSGDVDRSLLRDLAEQIRDDLIQDSEITQVEVSGIPPVEIGIEVPLKHLREYNLTLGQIADTVRRSALELPAGGVKTSSGEVLLRTQERRDFAVEFGDIPIVAANDGTMVRLADLADLQDGFEDTSEEAFFNGLRSLKLDVFRVGKETPITVSDATRRHVERWNASLPEGVTLTMWDDRSEIFRGRVELLLKNAFLGLILVLLLLGLFLDPRLAFWVTLGIPISILGAFLLIPFLGASINMVSLFAFIVTIGIIVDDAIMVGESVYHERQQGLSWPKAAVAGARVMSMPVNFAVLTNVIAFLPLFFVPGITGKIFVQIPAIVVPVLLVSLVESLLVLPAHLSHGHGQSQFWRVLSRPQAFFGKALDWFIQRPFRRVLTAALHNRYLTMALGCAILILSVGAVIGGRVKFSFLPRIESDEVTAQAVLPVGAPIEETRLIQARLVEAAQKTLAENGGAEIAQGIYAQLGSVLAGRGPVVSGTGRGGSHLAAVQVALQSADKREISAIEFSKAWRANAGPIAGLESLTFSGAIHGGGGDPVDIELSHQDREVLEAAARDLAEQVAAYRGVSDLNDGVSQGKVQQSFSLREEARSLGLTTLDLAQQVRDSFYGAEALRQQRGRHEVRVLVRLPKAEREAFYTVENLILRNPAGVEIMLAQAADMEPGQAYTEINRTDGRRVICVTADVDETVGNANEILTDLQAKVLPKIVQKYPGLSFSLEGERRSQQESMAALGFGFVLALFAIYAMLALPFRSYIQPLIVMLSIPFGIVGALLGHVFLGYGLSIISMFGIIALAGVVVNDSLVLIVQANRNQANGMNPLESVQEASIRRFRPIVLTSLTTFFGLAPMIFETSMQARFIIPMAISLGFGILFSTIVILLLVPSAYMALEDIHSLGRSFRDWVRGGPVCATQ